MPHTRTLTLTGRLGICLVEKLLTWASRMLGPRSWDEAGDCIMWSLRDSDLGQISKDLAVLWKVTLLNTLVAVYFYGFLARLWSPDIWSSILSISVVLLLGETNVCLRKYGKPPVTWMEQNGTKGWPPQSKSELCRSTAFTLELIPTPSWDSRSYLPCKILGLLVSTIVWGTSLKIISL